MESIQAARAIGRRAAESALSASRAAGIVREYMRVTAVRGPLLDLDRGADGVSMPISGVPMTTACSSVKVGDTVVVDTFRHKPLAVGVMAR